MAKYPFLPKCILSFAILILLVCTSLFNPIFGQSPCIINQLCQSPTGPEYSNFPPAEYKFIDLQWRMTWFDAINECRSEGTGWDLLSIESSTERNWVLRMAAMQTYTDINYQDRLWYVNAHMYLYNSEYPAWSSKQPLGMFALRHGVRYW